MSDTDLAERVSELEERVAYLESELDISVEKQRFERQIKRISVSQEDYEIDTNGMGYYTAEVRVPPGDLPHVTNRIEKAKDLGWSVKESAEDVIILSVEQGLINK